MTPIIQDKDTIPAHMPTNNRPRNTGSSMDDDASRLDALAKVTGKAKYGRDMYEPGQLFVSFIRCPYGAATLESFDITKAKSVPGVLEVTFTSDNRRGRYHGHTIGYIVAESKTALRRGLSALNAKWSLDRDIKTGITDTIQSDPHDSAAKRDKTNGADFVLDAVYSTPVQTHSSLETHGVMAHHRGDNAVVYASTQGTFTVRDGLTGDDGFGLPASAVEVRCQYVGGGFGSKFGPGKEGVLAAQISKKYNKPVSLFCDRDEEHLDTGNRPSALSYTTIGIKRDGTITGGMIKNYGGVGVGGGGGVRFPSGRYDFANVDAGRTEDVSFNAGGPRAMRAPGYPQGAFIEELVIDELATGIGMDPLELRMKIDRDDVRKEMYQLGAEMIGWNRREKTGSQSGSIRRGFGMGSTDWPRRDSAAEAEVIILRDGSVSARTGTQDIGTGQRTAMGICAARELGVSLDIVDVRIGNSSLPEGPASGGSVTLANSSIAMMAAAADAKQKFLKSIADRAGGDASEFDIKDGQVVRDGKKVMSFAEACAKMSTETITGRGDNGRSNRQKYIGEGSSAGAQFVELEVDAETGVITIKKVVAVQACGKVVCRKTAESQVIGGVIQGLSFALFEERLLDKSNGAMINPNLEQYKILGTADMPYIVPVLWKKGQTGVRPLGEPPVVPTAGATACALFNAIGTPVRDLPLTPRKVLAALKGGAA